MNEPISKLKRGVPDEKSLGKYIRRIRKHRKLKQTDLARAIGKSSQYICDLEKGRRGTRLAPELAMLIADYLQVPLTQLMSYHINLAPITNGSQLAEVYRSLRHKGRAKRILLAMESAQKAVEELEDEAKAKRVTPRAESIILRVRSSLKDLKSALTVG